MPSLSVVHTDPSRRRKLAPALSSPPKHRLPSASPGENHLKPTGTSSSVRPRPATTRSIMLLETSVLPTAAVGPLRAMPQQVANRDRQVVIRVHQAHRRRDDAVAVGVGVVAPGDVEAILQADEAGHRVRTRAVHADLAVVIQGHEPERRIDARIDHVDVEAVQRGDARPVGHGGAAHRIDADTQPRGADGLHVDDRAEVVDVVGREVALRDAVGGDGLRVRHARDAGVAIGEQGVGAVFDPAGDVGVGGAAVRRVVLEAAVLRRVVRGGDDEAVGERPRACRHCARGWRAR